MCERRGGRKERDVGSRLLFSFERISARAQNKGHLLMESRSGHSLSGPREASPWRNVMANPKVVPDNLSSALLQQIISKGDLSSAPSWRPHPDDYIIKDTAHGFLSPIKNLESCSSELDEETKGKSILTVAAPISLPPFRKPLGRLLQAIYGSCSCFDNRFGASLVSATSSAPCCPPLSVGAEEVCSQPPSA